MLASTCQYFLEKQKTAIWYFLSLWEKTGVIFTKVLNLFHLRGIYHRGYFLLLFCEFRSLLRKSRSVKKGQDHLFCLQYIFLSYTLATSSHLLVGMFTIVMMLRCLLPSKCLNINVTLNATKSEQKETKNAIQLSCCGRLVCFSSPFLKNSTLSRCVFKNEQHSNFFKILFKKTNSREIISCFWFLNINIFSTFHVKDRFSFNEVF